MHVSVNMLVLHKCWLLQAILKYVTKYNKTSNAILYEGLHVNFFSRYPPSPRYVSPGNLAAAVTNREEFLRTLES